MPRQCTQQKIDTMRRKYDTTRWPIKKIAAHVHVAPGTVVKYIDHRDIRPSK